MIYGVNKIELGINDILQLIELTLGEGKLLSYQESLKPYFPNYLLNPSILNLNFRSFWK